MFKKIVQNGSDLPFKFCKIGLQKILFIFGRKMVVCCFYRMSDNDPPSGSYINILRVKAALFV